MTEFLFCVGMFMIQGLMILSGVRPLKKSIVQGVVVTVAFCLIRYLWRVHW